MAKKDPDEAHRRTDEELEKLEKHIAKEYQKAADELQEKIDAYFASFEKRDAEQKSLLDAGKITEQEYKQWRLAQIGRGRRFEALRDRVAERITNAKEIAFSYVNDDMPKIYALNRAYTIKTAISETGDALSAVDFALFDEHTAKRLLVERPNLMPSMPPLWVVDQKKEFEYGKLQITAWTTQGILQGHSVNKIAQHLRENFLGHYDRKGNWIPGDDITSAVRAARTAITAAENAGRQDAADELEKKGAIVKKIWIATHDSRTRPEHMQADGQTVDSKKPFIVGGEKLMFPGDASLGASGWNLYNCRCSRKNKVIGFRSILTEEQRKRANIRVD